MSHIVCLDSEQRLDHSSFVYSILYLLLSRLLHLIDVMKCFHNVHNYADVVKCNLFIVLFCSSCKSCI